VHRFSLSTDQLRIGDKLSFELEIEHDAPKNAALFRLEYAVHYVKANGSRSVKVFQILERELQAGEKLALKRQQAFADLTTRKHYPGEHELAIHLNGQAIGRASFLLQPG
jgi:hypothetical protein